MISSATLLTPVPSCSSSSSSSDSSHSNGRFNSQTQTSKISRHEKQSSCPSDNNRLPPFSAICSKRRQRMNCWMGRTASLLATLCLLSLSLNVPPAEAMPRPEPPKVSVGAIYMLAKEKELILEQKKLPSWTNQNSEQVFGIPQAKDVGKYEISLKEGTAVVRVTEEQEDTCGPDRTTIWLEIVFPQKLGELSIATQFEETKKLLSKLKDVGVKLADVRVFPRSYLDSYRTVTEIIHELDEWSTTPRDQTVFVVNISCGELSDQATEVINAAADNEFDFQVVQGHLKKSSSTNLAEDQPETKTKEQKKKQEMDQQKSSSVMILLFVLTAMLAVVLIVIAAYWLVTKRSQKGEKQVEAAVNGKGSARTQSDDVNKDGIILSPDQSNATVLTPMLPTAKTGESNKANNELSPAKPARS